ncbi:hypothetical protein ACFL2X_03630 [Candidatus Latescibacterota bacterium]
MTSSNQKIISPLKAIRKYCVDNCMVKQPYEVKLCQTEDCRIYGLRFGKNPYYLKVLKQIKERCLDCSGFSHTEVRDCWKVDCELYPFRLGKNPNRAGIGRTAEEMKALQENKLLTVDI